MEKFPKDLNVEELDPETYKQYIEELRRQLGVTECSGCPVLPPQEVPPTRWLDVVLRTSNNAITLRIRRDNVYLDGYQNNAGDWFEFGNDRDRPPPPQLIPGSSFLGFGGGYGSMASALGPTQNRGTIPLGYNQLINAVNQLATSTNRRMRAESLIVVIQMICESVRLIAISDHLVNTFYNNEPAPLWMQELENGWGALSAAVLRSGGNPQQFQIDQNNMQIQTLTQAVAVLGILLNFRCTPSKRVPRMAAENDGQCPVGRPLVEVFWVRIEDIDKEDPGDLFGTITVTDGLSSQYMYNRNREDYESISPGDTILLTGPARSILAYDSFTINVDLKDKDRFSPDDEVSRGQISWNVYETTNDYDKLLCDKVDGQYGSVTVNYAVFSDAVEATVEVTLINGDKEDPADVYGKLTAGNGMNEYLIFWKTSDEYIEVSPGERISLLRSAVAVPLNSSLMISANLKDHDKISPDDEIATGIAKFPAQPSGTFMENISGKYGEIQVKVTWS